MILISGIHNTIIINITKRSQKNMNMHIFVALFCCIVSIGGIVIASIVAEMIRAINYWSYRDIRTTQDLEANIRSLHPNITMSSSHITMNATTPYGVFVYKKRLM